MLLAKSKKVYFGWFSSVIRSKTFGQLYNQALASSFRLDRTRVAPQRKAWGIYGAVPLQGVLFTQTLYFCLQSFISSSDHVLLGGKSTSFSVLLGRVTSTNVIPETSSHYS